MKRYFGLCGAPAAGKSSVQKILENDFHVIPIDDAERLRRAAMAIYDLSLHDVSTQEGKSKLVSFGHHAASVRQLLGELGEHIEARDPLFFARKARQEAERKFPGQCVSFGSLRMNQAEIFQDAQSLVIEVKQQGVCATRPFDTYNPTLAHISISNPFDPSAPKESFQRLRTIVHEAVGPFFEREPNP